MSNERKGLIGLVLIVLVAWGWVMFGGQPTTIDSNWERAESLLEDVYGGDLNMPVRTYLEAFAAETSKEPIEDDDELAHHYLKTIRRTHEDVRIKFEQRQAVVPWAKRVQALEAEIAKLRADAKDEDDKVEETTGD